MASKSVSKGSDFPSFNIQSYIRVRPLDHKEKRNSHLKFSTEEVLIKSAAEATARNKKTLSFDRIFNGKTEQITVYNTVVKPMIKEIMQGYNCTVFAYGQTGSGKTYTMMGNQEGSDLSALEVAHLGIIPRAMNEIFDELNKIGTEHQISISYMELYNEKLGSLISEETNIQLIDDSEGGVILRGLNPIVVKSRQEAHKLLLEGSAKKQMASTLLNLNSSRSHTIFTVKVVIREPLVEGKDHVVRIGKLHLIDLAGSESVAKSGASEAGASANRRLAEASNINKSLLTLGRVITSIIENNTHIPYRESKLTRFLRDSLGGKTKTCIIGTVSPAQCNSDETENTLSYAYKARSIKNKPVKNQKLSKTEFIQVTDEKISKLKRDIEAVRQGEGYFVAKETHEEMNNIMRLLQEQVRLWSDRYNEIFASYEELKETFNGLSVEYEDKRSEVAELEAAREVLGSKIEDMKKHLILREYLISEYQRAEGKLTDQAKACKSVLENLVEHENLLRDAIKRKEDCESKNLTALEEFKAKIFNKLEAFQLKLETLFENQISQSKRAARVPGVVAELVGDQHRLILFQMKNLQDRVRDFYSEYFKAEEEKRTGEIMAETTRLEASLCQVLEDHDARFEELYPEVIQPFIVTFNEQLQTLLVTLQTAKNDMDAVNSDGKSLQSELLQVISTFECIKTFFDEALCVLHEDLNEKLEANESKQNADQCFKEVKELHQYLGEIPALVTKLKKSITNLQASTSKTKQKLQSTKSTIDRVQTEVDETVDRVCSRSSDLVEKLFTNQAEMSVSHDQLMEQVNCQLKAAAKTGFSVMTKLNNDINKESGTVKTSQELIEQQVLSLQRCAKKQGEEIGLGIKEWGRVTDFKAEEVSSDITDLDSTVEADMKEGNAHLAESSADLQEVLNHCYESTGSITADHDQMQYEPDVPSGKTPRRLNPESSIYPREFVSIEPRSVLMERLAQMPHSSTETLLPQNENSTAAQKQKKTLKISEKLITMCHERKPFKWPLTPYNSTN